MRVANFKYPLLKLVSTLIVLILVLMPFHAFLTVWAASMVGHYISVRLWKEVLLLICVLGVVGLLLIDHKIRSHTLTRRLVWLIIAYLFLQLANGLIALHFGRVTPKAFAYGLLLNTRFLVFFFVTWAVALRTSRLRAHWQGIVLVPSAIVIIFGLLQVFVLPREFLAHFGYGPNTIFPYETINHNIHYVRIASTLRGANPLGAYLLIPLSVLTVLLTTAKRNWSKVSLWFAGLGALFFSFSRGAWIGAMLSVGVVVALQLRTRELQKKALIIACASLILLAGLAVVLHRSSRFENIFLHTQSNSAIKSSSNEGHISALKAGLHDISREPLGRGVGTAGQASVYNKSTRIAEDYFIQIGQETGWLGMGLFILINIGVGYLLWSRRADPLALSLFASLVGLSVVNLLSHAWSDDTLAYLWWGLAGIAMAPVKKTDKA